MRRWLASGVVVAVVVAAVVFAWPEPVDAIVLHGTFTDDDQSPHQNGIEAVAAAGITVGCNPPANNHFCPNQNVTRAQAATFLARALNLPDDGHDYFTDDDGHILEGGINKLAAAGITAGCNPPVNSRFCPDRTLTRAEFAAFIARGLSLPPTSTNFFVDDNGHVLENSINRIAAAGITVGCNPPTNNRFCPDRVLTRGEVATLLTRALGLPQNPQRILLGSWSPITCSKDGKTCSLLVDTFGGRYHQIQEGFFQRLPYQGTEQAQFTASNTTFTLTLNGTVVSTSQLPIATSSAQATRMWNTTTLVFPNGNHSLVGEWRWNGTLIQKTTATIRAD
jgi:hypothetical protein